MFDFPASPTEGQTYLPAGGPQYVYGAGAWRMLNAANPAGWEPIESAAYSNVAFWSRTDLSAFRTLQLIGFAKPVTDNVVAAFTTSVNAGVSWETGASDYNVGARYNLFTGAQSFSSQARADIVLAQAQAISNNANQGGIFLNIFFQDFNQPAQTRYRGDMFYYATSTAPSDMELCGNRTVAVVNNGLRFMFATGNIASMHVTLSGIRG